jgi:hypothetical protein
MERIEPFVSGEEQKEKVEFVMLNGTEEEEERIAGESDAVEMLVDLLE